MSLLVLYYNSYHVIMARLYNLLILGSRLTGGILPLSNSQKQANNLSLFCCVVQYVPVCTQLRFYVQLYSSKMAECQNSVSVH